MSDDDQFTMLNYIDAAAYSTTHKCKDFFCVESLSMTKGPALAAQLYLLECCDFRRHSSQKQRFGPSHVQSRGACVHTRRLPAKRQE